MSIIPREGFPGARRDAMTLWRHLPGGTLRASGLADYPGAAPDLRGSGRAVPADPGGLPGKPPGSDDPPGMTEPARRAVKGGPQPGDLAEAHRVFGGMADGAAVRQPFGTIFFPSGFGMLTDRFGIDRMVVTSAGRPGSSIDEKATGVRDEFHSLPSFRGQLRRGDGGLCRALWRHRPADDAL